MHLGEMHFKEIAQSMAKRNAVHIVKAGSDLIETVEGKYELLLLEQIC